MNDFSFNVMYTMLTRLILKLTRSHSQICSIVSSVFTQNVHFGTPVSLILYDKVFVT